MFSRQPTASFLLTTLLTGIGIVLITEPANRFPESSSIRQAATVEDSPPASCPVTQAPPKPFVPPAPYPANGYPHGFWFGTEKLWTRLPANGTWKGLGHYQLNESAFRQKLFWWRQGYDWRMEHAPTLTVTGKRLDAASPPLKSDDHANTIWTDDDRDHAFIVNAIDIPTLGCWQITGEYHGDELTFVVWVAP